MLITCYWVVAFTFFFLVYIINASIFKKSNFYSIYDQVRSVGSNCLVGFGSIGLMKCCQYPFTISAYRSQVWSRKVQRK